MLSWWYARILLTYVHKIYTNISISTIRRNFVFIFLCTNVWYVCLSVWGVRECAKLINKKQVWLKLHELFVRIHFSFTLTHTHTHITFFHSYLGLGCFLLKRVCSFFTALNHTSKLKAFTLDDVKKKLRLTEISASSFWHILCRRFRRSRLYNNNVIRDIKYVWFALLLRKKNLKWGAFGIELNVWRDVISCW